MLTRPPRERPVLPGRNTWLYALGTHDASVRAYPDACDFYGTSPTVTGHHPTWAVMHNTTTTSSFAYLWLCLTEINCSIYGQGECGYWQITEDRPTAEAQAKQHAVGHDEAALAAYLDTADRPPTTVLIPTQKQVETAVRRAQTNGPCSMSDIKTALLRMRAADGCTSVSHLGTRLGQLMARGRMTVHQQREWSALTGVAWPCRTPHDVLYATREQAESWKHTKPIRAAA